MRSHLAGLGNMERYQYDQAVAEFRLVHQRAPKWISGAVNLAIALLNQAGVTAQSGGAKSGLAPAPEALALLDEVLGREPANLYAHYCRGLILEASGRLVEAHREFEFVTKQDPFDAVSWYKLASTATDPLDPDRPAGPEQAEDLILLYQRALELNPYLVNALYKLQVAYGWTGQNDRQREVQALWNRLNPRSHAAGPGDTTDTFYGAMGRYATVIDQVGRLRSEASPGAPPRFATPRPIVVRLKPGDRWAERSDFTGPNEVIGRIRDRFGAGMATFDVDGDGRLDLFLTASIVGPAGLRDVLLLNRGEGRFEDLSTSFGLPVDQSSLGVAAGDFDADRRVDLILTGLGRNRLYRNLATRFEDVSAQAGLGDTRAISLTARWLDLDQDGDLDLFIINYASVDEPRATFMEERHEGLPNLVLRNDGRPSPVVGRPEDNWVPLALATEGLPATAGLSVKFSRWPGKAGLTDDTARHTSIATLDFDNDRDLDLILGADGTAPVALSNDRLGRFHVTELRLSTTPVSIDGLLVTDVDKDGHADLAVLTRQGRVQLWRNNTERKRAGGTISWEQWPTNSLGWRSALAADLDLDTWPDLIGLSQVGGPGVEWARNEGPRLATSALALGPGPDMGHAPFGLSYSDVLGDPLPDLIVARYGAPPSVARNLGNGHHWMALELAGRWQQYPAAMRTNPHGIGTRVAVRGQGLEVAFDHVSREAGLGQSVDPLVLGLGKAPSATLIQLRWPDGTAQSEMNVAGDRQLTIHEHNRKAGSCPILFTWNGNRFVCQGDYLGGGGLGYLVSPGQLSVPDRDESVAINARDLQVDHGVFRLAVAEPMDECSYLDQLTLEVIDRPVDIRVAPDERFAPAGPRPTGSVQAWRTEITPVRATDHAGRDVTELLRTWDRRTVEDFARLSTWIGYAEPHGIVLDFGTRLSQLGKDDPILLCLAGWVEYPYSQTNYAAATAGVPLVEPSVERLRFDGTWEVIEANAGYPAGLPRLTTLDLTGKLTGPTCSIRLRTNMECYWDQAFLALRDPQLPLRISSLAVARGQLLERGYLSEVTPDGRLPLLYDYDHVDPTPPARMEGMLTRLGSVESLLTEDDDRLCVLGPGDELQLEFVATHLPALPDGWARTFVLKSVGYCKDADPFTSSGDTVGPLPWRGMPAYPFGPESARPVDPGYRDYLEHFQTRRSEGP